MKIIDSSFLIAIISDTKCEKMVKRLLKLNHELVISYCVCQEIICGPSGKIIQKFIDDNIINVVQLNTAEEIVDLQTRYPYLGIGELDTILSYEKISNNTSKYCILDDKQARKTAKKRNISLTGTLGLLDLMRNRKIISIQEFKNVISDLQKSGFRMPKEFIK